MRGYAELRCKSNFSFLRGASHPEELVSRAAELGVSALALTDLDGLHGAVRAHAEARRTGLPMLVGAELTCADLGVSGDRARQVVLLARDREGYANLCRLATAVHCGGALGKGHEAPVRPDSTGIAYRQLAEGARGLFALYPGADAEEAARLREAFGRRLALAVARHRVAGEEVGIAAARTVGRRLAVPVVVTNDVHTADRRRQPLQDVLTCIRLGTTVEKAGRRLFPNAERTLKGPEEIAQLWSDFPEGVEATLDVAAQCAFRLEEIRGEHPLPPIMAAGDSRSGMELLRGLVAEGAGWRWPGGPPDDVRRQIARELDLVEQLGYASYFLTVWDIVRFARSRGILCQGRGSAANSVVCYCLGITSIDPVRMGLLFERFISVERGEPPDIDVDFEHERREEVLQYVYERYGRDHAGLVCEVISYRGRSAVRDVGKALGLSLGQVDRLAKIIGAYEDVSGVTPELLEQAGLDGAASPTIRQTLLLSQEIQRFPRHISTHVGGFLITSRPLCETVPLEPAAMPGRTIGQWDKDDIAEMGLLKVDLLGLGMLSALSRSLKLLATLHPAPRDMPGYPYGDASSEPRRDASGARRVADGTDPVMSARGLRDGGTDPGMSARGLRDGGTHLNGAGNAECDDAGSGRCAGAARAPDDRFWPDSLATIPAEDPAVYAMISRADTVGVFQIESRAQMSLLPRLKPRCFYDLVISVAIIRPGPIQGGMIHPFLRRRDGLEPVEYPYEPLRAVLEKTLGVPLFQEQAMRLAIVAAGFTPGEADELRRVMTHKRSHERMESMKARLVSGMAQRGISRADSETIFRQLLGFAGYGFPESHAASFALLVYASAWIKRYHPAVFACALLDSQPMGFYAPHTIVEDAKRHGVEVRGVDVQYSAWESTLEGAKPGSVVAPGEVPVLRLGLCIVKGLPRAAGEALVEARRRAPFASAADLARRARLSRAVVSRLAEAGALRSLAPERHQAAWRALSVSAAPAQDDLFAGLELPEPSVELPPTTAAEEVARDYATVGLSDRAHPMAMLRPALASRRIRTARELARLPDRAPVEIAGLVIIRQRPQTASGIVFVSLEDETGIANLVVMPDVYDRYRPLIRGTSFLVARGRVERNGAVVNVRVSEIAPLRPARDLSIPARDFR